MAGANWWALGLFVALLALRLPFARWAEAGQLLNPDEIETALMGADRFLGVPPCQTHWPASLNQLLLLPVLGADMLVQSHFRPTGAAFIEYVAGIYRSPWHTVWLSRVIVVVASSLGLASLVVPLARRGAGAWACVVALLLTATTPSLWQASIMSLGNGLALGLGCLAIAVSLSEACGGHPLHRPVAAGALLGLMLASRNTMAPFVPLVGAILASRSSRPWRDLVAMTLMMAVALVAAFPYVWTEPIRVARATVGAYIKHGEASGLRAALGMMVKVVPSWLLGASVLAVIAGVRHRQWWLVGGLALATATILIPAARSPEIVERYYQAMVPICAVMAILLLVIPARGYLRGESEGLRRATVAVGLAAAAGIMVWQIVSRPELKSNKLTAMRPAEVRESLAALSGRRVLLPAWYWPWVLDLATRESLRDTVTRVESTMWGGGHLSFTSSFGLDQALVTGLRADFNDKEQAFAARLRAVAAGKAEGTVNIGVYADPAWAKRFGQLTLEEALAVLRVGRADAVLAEEAPNGDEFSSQSVAGGCLLTRRP
ncbi:MAG TPA: hypothetical protein VMT17_08065 [Anaeromyxobacteraceae bacterium]|nr:hypothetical protein [Anaeromyxobacteraceae bacterium]